MRICLISNYDGIADEGIKNVSHNLYIEISKNHQVLYIDSKNILNKEYWKKMKKFDPQIVHIFLRPIFKVLIISKIIKYYLGNGSFMIMSALQPPVNNFSYRIFPLIKPDLFLVQSRNTENLLKNIGVDTCFLPNGVDINKFKCVSIEIKNNLRKKYNLDNEKFILLHVGHINKGRNLQILSDLQKIKNVQVLIIGSTNSFNFDEDVYNNLIKNGCITWRKYFNNIEDIYQLSDCYIFPTKDENYCVEIPLSVLEAMSCNLPVITTRFGALEELFSEGNGFSFADSYDDFLDKINYIIDNDTNIQTRKNVLSYDWTNVHCMIEKIYEKVVKNEK